MKNYKLEWVVSSEGPPATWWTTYAEISGGKIESGKLWSLAWVPLTKTVRTDSESKA